MRIGFTYDLRADYLAQGYSPEETAEFDGDAVIDAVEAALSGLGHEVDRIGHVRSLVARLAAGDRWDLVFNLAEGLSGYAREAQVPALLEAYGIPCTFSDPLTCALTLDKAMAKRVLRDAGLPTPAFAEVAAPADLDGLRLPFPLFVKPAAEGSSKGITGRSLCRDGDDLRRACLDLVARYRQPALVETFLPGREFTVGLLGTGADARVLGVLEVCPAGPAAGADFAYDFEHKENWADLVDYRLAPDGDPEAALAAATALAAWRVLRGRDAGRIDLRSDAVGVPHFLEANPLAGLHPVKSDLVILARLRGMDYRTLIGEILASACRRMG